MPRPRPPVREEDEPMAMTWTAGRVAAVTIIVLTIGFWVWVFAGGPDQANPDRLADRSYVDRTEKACYSLKRDLAKLPNAADIRSADHRAEVLDQATAKVSTMVRTIEADAPTKGDDGKRLRGWFEDWHAYLGDRADYAERLRADPKARFYVSQNKRLKASVDDTIQTFADVNAMADCETPGDVG